MKYPNTEITLDVVQLNNHYFIIGNTEKFKMIPGDKAFNKKSQEIFTVISNDSKFGFRPEVYEIIANEADSGYSKIFATTAEDLDITVVPIEYFIYNNELSIIMQTQQNNIEEFEDIFKKTCKF